MTPMVHVALVGAVAALLSYVFTDVAKRVALRLGVVAAPRPERWHRQPVPLLGGIAILAGVLAAVAVMPQVSREIWIVLAGAVILFLVGLVDDVRPLSPQIKLVSQVAVASVIAGLGLQLHLTGQPVADFVLTLLWIVGITNAFNLLDNMDGLAAGLAVITVGFRLVFYIADGNVAAAGFAAAIAGAATGFLIHNLRPASVFMGDAGSLFLGSLVAGLSLVGGYPYSRSVFSVLLFPVIVLLVPIFDTTLVAVTRLLAGRSVAAGGRDHSSHRLVGLGLTERKAVLALYALSICSGLVALFTYRYGLTYGSVLIVFLLLGAGVLGVSLARFVVYADEPGAGQASLARLEGDFVFLRPLAIIAIDVTLIVVAYYSAYLLRFEEQFDLYRQVFIDSLPYVIVCKLVIFAALGLHQPIWRYVGVRDLLRIVWAVSLGSLVSVVVVVYAYRFVDFSRAVFILDWLLLLVGMSGIRLFSRVFGELAGQAASPRRRVLVYGAGNGGVLTVREIQSNAGLDRVVVGFLDDDRSKLRSRVLGVPVFGGVDALDQTVRRLSIDEVVVSSTKVPAERIDVIRTQCESLGITLSRASLRLERPGP